jgi:hypothetical protein
VRQPEPRPDKIRRAVAALRGLLKPIAAGVAAGVTVESREAAQKIIEHVTAALT